MLVDSHCHLDFKEYADDLDAVLARAAAAGVGTMVTICTKVSAFAAVRAIAERHTNVYCSVGIHPHEAAHEPGADAAQLVALARHPKVVGIGETGLDYHYDHSPRDRQKAVFRAHIQAAREAGLPLIVHSREADQDTAALLAEGAAAGPLTGVMHCFSSTRYLAEKALELGFYISLSGIVTFKNADDLRAIARDLPADRLLVETDAPYLAPVPHRGKRNEPAFVAETAAAAAALRERERERERGSRQRAIRTERRGEAHPLLGSSETALPVPSNVSVQHTLAAENEFCFGFGYRAICCEMCMDDT